MNSSEIHSVRGWWRRSPVHRTVKSSFNKNAFSPDMQSGLNIYFTIMPINDGNTVNE